MNEILKRLIVGIALTKECNFRCGYCYPFGQSKVIGNDMSLEEAVEIVKAATEIGFVKFKFTGGEPTKFKGFKELIRYTVESNPNVLVHVVTNGSTLNENSNLFKEYKNNLLLQISIDSLLQSSISKGIFKILTPEIHRQLSDLRAAGVKMRINMVVMKHNAKEVYEIIQEAINIKADLKLFSLFLQDQYISTILDYSKVDEITPLSAFDYWRKNFYDLGGIAHKLEKKAIQKLSSTDIDGSFGIPEYSYVITGDTIIIVKDTTRGAFYNRDFCFSCPFFRRLCEKGVYNPMVSSSSTLHIDDCYNTDLRWNLRNTTYQEKVLAFKSILMVFRNLEHISFPLRLSECKQLIRKRALKRQINHE